MVDERWVWQWLITLLQQEPAHTNGYRRQRRKRGRWWDRATERCWYDSRTGLGMNRDQMRYWQSRHPDTADTGGKRG